MDVYEFHGGSLPLLISVPHAGTCVPDDIAGRLSPAAQALPDTDWWVRELYEFARGLGASMIAANHSRYVVDLNRAPDSASLYAAHPTSPVCAQHTFAGEPVYASGAEPDASEVAQRVDRYWRPYHDRIAAELHRMRRRHGVALLWDAHSIASEIPALFQGVLPEFNFGTRDDASCPRRIAQDLLDVVRTDGRFGGVLNGRFRGGYITSHYGRPDEGVYAVQLELAQRAYMDEAGRGGGWDADRARDAAAVIERLLLRFIEGVAAARV